MKFSAAQHFIKSNSLLLGASSALLVALAVGGGIAVSGGSSSAQSGGCAPVPSGLEAWYHLDEKAGDITIVDSSGHNHNGKANPGPVNSGGPAVFSTPKVNGALLFTTMSSYVDVPPDPGINAVGKASFTIDAWVKSTTTAFASPLISKFDAGTQTGFRLFLENDKLRLEVTTPSGVNQTVVGPTFTVTPWHFITMTWYRSANAAKVTLSVDGVSVLQTLSNVGPINNTGDLFLGKTLMGSASPLPEPFGLDEVEIFNGVVPKKNLDAIQAAGPAGKCTPTPTPPHEGCAHVPAGLEAWWPLDEKKGASVAVDISGHSHNGQSVPGPIGMGGPGAVTGKVNGALYFVPPAYVDVLNQPSLDIGSGAFTVDAWVMFGGSGPGSPYYHQTNILPIIDKFSPNSPSSGTGYAFYLLNVINSTSTYVGLYFSYGNGTPVLDTSGGPILSSVSYGWHFVAATVDPKGATTTTSVYLDGNQIGSTTLPTPPPIVSNVDPFIYGSRLGPLFQWNVVPEYPIDEVEIFKAALSLNELKAIYLAGPVGKCKPTPTPGGGTTATDTGHSADLSPAPTATTGPGDVVPDTVATPQLTTDSPPTPIPTPRGIDVLPATIPTLPAGGADVVPPTFTPTPTPRAIVDVPSTATPRVEVPPTFTPAPPPTQQVIVVIPSTLTPTPTQRIVVFIPTAVPTRPVDTPPTKTPVRGPAPAPGPAQPGQLIPGPGAS